MIDRLLRHDDPDVDRHERYDRTAPGRVPVTARLAPRTVVLRAAADANGVTPGADAAIDRARGSSGAPLPDDARARFESSLGADLSAVRVHTGAESATAAAAVGARAYTVGNDIHFAAGQYAPGDPFGLHLLAHEVAHTQQQSPSPQFKLEVSTPGDSHEVEADRAADAMVRGEPAAVGTGVGVARVMREAIEAGAEISGHKAKVSLTSPKFPLGPIPGKWASISGDVRIGGEVEVEFPAPAKHGEGHGEAHGGHAAEPGGLSGAAKPQANEIALKYGKKLWEPEQQHAVVESVELELEAGAKNPGSTKHEPQGALAVAIVCKLQNGQTARGVLNAVKVEEKDGVPCDLNVGVLDLEYEKSFPFFKDVPFEGVKLSGSIKAAAALHITPNKVQLMAELMKKFGPQLMAEFGGTALRGVSEIMGSAEANVGILMSYLAVKTYLAYMEDFDEDQDAVHRAESACAGFVTGAMSMFGGGNEGRDATFTSWYIEGRSQIHAGLKKMVSTIMANPKWAASGITEAEVREAIVEKCTREAGTMRTEISGRMDGPIKALYLQRWRDQLSLSRRIFTNTDSAEHRVRAQLGFKRKADVPDVTTGPEDAEPDK